MPGQGRSNDDFVKVRRSYDFLRRNAKRDQQVIMLDELVEASGWTRGYTETNISKRLGEFLVETGPGKYRLKRHIVDVRYQDYVQLFRQKQTVFTRYNQYTNPDVTVYEFFLPLTREDVLRQALDRLFYRETVVERLRQIGLDEAAKHFSRDNFNSEDEFLAHICDFAADRLGGYSISHVNGRYRKGGLLTRAEAAKRQEDGDDYLIDETTAVVRFILPHVTRQIRVESDEEVGERLQLRLDFLDQAEEARLADLQSLDLRRTEWLFHNLFVHTVIRAIRSQDEIWLLESGVNHRLFRFVSADRDEQQGGQSEKTPADQVSDEVRGLTSYLLEKLPGYRITIRSANLCFRCQAEDFYLEVPTNIMLELYRADLIESMFLQPGIVPH